MENYCTNCGKIGHNNKNCTIPITSYGIICINVNTLSVQQIENFLYNKYIDIEDYNYKNLNFINKIYKYKDDVKFLLIQRKHSLSYIEFIRGRYNEKDTSNIEKLFSLMAINEIENIKNNDFQVLWDNLWRKTARNKAFLKELNMSKSKFIYCKKNNLFDKMFSNYESPEWEFPKGRKNKFEKNLDCAIREFEEETRFTNYTLYNRINCIEEVFKGSNLINYKHVYYIAGSDISVVDEICDMYEIGNIGWYSYEDVIKLLRPYSITKIDIINQLYFFIISILEKTSNCKSIIKKNYI